MHTYNSQSESFLPQRLLHVENLRIHVGGLFRSYNIDQYGTLSGFFKDLFNGRHCCHDYREIFPGTWPRVIDPRNMVGRESS